MSAVTKKTTEEEIDKLLIGKPVIRRLASPADLVVKNSTSAMQMSGYVSVGTPDLSNDIVEPDAFKAYLHRYQANPVYCYMHDAFMPIGRVENVSIDSKGLYLDNITLANIEVNEKYIWPLIKEGVLKQQSIGFISIDADWNSAGYYVHKKVYLLESSIVTVACNPDASIDTVKVLPGFENSLTVSDLIRSYNKGVLLPGFEIKKQISTYVSADTKTDSETDLETKQNVTHETRDMMDLIAIDLTDYTHSTDQVVGFPKPHSVKRVAAFERTHAAKRVSDDGKEVFLFPVAEITESGGVAFSWTKAATSMMRLFGVNNGAQYADSLRYAVMKSIAHAYRELGKAVPEFDGVPLDDMREEDFKILKFTDVDFKEDEKDLYAEITVKNGLGRIENVFKSYTTKNQVPVGLLKTVLKSAWGYFSMYVDAETQEDAEFISDVVALLGKYNKEDATETPEGAYAERGVASDDDVQLTDESQKKNEILGQFFNHVSEFNKLRISE